MMDIDSVLKSHGIGIGGSNIKSIQRGYARIDNTSYPITISPVDTTKAIVRIKVTNYTETNSQIRNNLTSIELTNSTTVTLKKNATGNTFDIYWEVIEFNNVKNIQSGVKEITASVDNITVSSVDTTKCVLFYSYTSNNTATESISHLVAIGITSNTLLHILQYPSTEKLIQWYLIEFN
jgi:hypothetical protein